MYLNNKRMVLLLVLLTCAVSYSPVSAAQSTVTKPSSQVDQAQKLSIEFRGVQGELLDNVHKHVTLYNRLKNASPLTRGELRRLKRRVPQQIKDALLPFGYYLAKIATSGSASQLVYEINLNEPVRISGVSILIDGTTQQKASFDDWRKSYPLSAGDILNQVAYEQQKKKLMSLALRNGYFDAKYANSSIVINAQRSAAEIKIRFVSGSQYSISAINIQWLKGDNPRDSKHLITDELLRSYISVEAGQQYNGDELVTTQRNLLGTPYFSRVSVQAGDTNSDSATLPINVTLTPRKRHTYSAEIGVGTDTGIRGGVGYENRRINSRGHNLSARVGASEIKTSAIVNYQIPRKRSALDNYNFFASLTEETGDSRRFKNTQIGVERLRSWQDSLFKLGLTASRETFSRLVEQDFETERTTRLLMPSLSWERTKADDLYFPTRGWSASATFRAASKDVGSDIDLAQVILESKRLYPLANGRLRLRFKLAGSLIDEAVDLPESLGFLAGGDDSVRGYRFESIGVNRNGEVTIAKNLATGSVEYEYPVKNGISLATFFDIGDAFDTSAKYKKGAGIGLRWRLPFGALRLDAASALDLDGKPFRLHFSFGTDL